MRRALLAVLLLAGFVAAWQLVASLPAVDDLTLASPVRDRAGAAPTTPRCCSATSA